MCENTTVKTPNKVFIHVPVSRKLQWLKACRRDVKDFSEKNIALYVCEEHFNVSTNLIISLFDYNMLG